MIPGLLWPLLWSTAEHGSSAAAPIAKEIIQVYLGQGAEGKMVAVVDEEDEED